MNSDQYNKDSAPSFGGMQNAGSSQPQSDSQARQDNVGGGNSSYPGQMAGHSQDNQYNMGQNSSSSVPNYAQNQMHSSNNAMGGDSRQMMSQSHMPPVQPGMGQSNYQNYPQQPYGQSMGMGQDMNRNMEGGMNSSMPQGFMQNSHMPGMMGVGSGSGMMGVNQNSAMQNYNNGSHGEKTFDPGNLNPLRQNTDSDRNLPLSPEAMKEFEGHINRCKQYKQTDVFPAVLLKNEEDGLRVIEHLKNQGVSLCATDTLDQTALFYACRDGKLKIVTLLLDNGCDPNHRDIYGQTALYYAARENRLDVAQKLIDVGVSLNNEDMHNQTALFYAAKQGNIDMCAKLLDHKANINHADNKRQTALHWAQKSKKIETVDYLISRGAEPISRKNDRKRPAPKKKPVNERKEPKQYVLTTLVNDQWLPLSEEDFKKLELECPEVYKIIKNPTELENLDIPDIPDDVPIYDHWEKPAKKIINTLGKHEMAWLFAYPVDTKAWGIEDYYDIIKKPMDFSTIKFKLNNNEYEKVDDFVNDVHQVFKNCILYNGESNQYSITAMKMRKDFDNQYNSLNMDFYKK